MPRNRPICHSGRSAINLDRNLNRDSAAQSPFRAAEWVPGQNLRTEPTPAIFAVRGDREGSAAAAHSGPWRQFQSTTQLLYTALGAALVSLFLGACFSPPLEPDPWQEVSGEIQRPELAEIAQRAWEWHLERNPVFASNQGDARYHARLQDQSKAARSQWSRRLEVLAEDLRAIPVDTLSDEDRVTHTFLLEYAHKQRVMIELDLVAWNVDPRSGPQVDFLTQSAEQPHATPREREQMLRRWSAMAVSIRQRLNNLERGLNDGRVASRHAVETTLAQLQAILDTDPKDSPLLAPALGGGRWVELAPDRTVASIAFEYLGDSSWESQLRLINRHLQDGDRRVYPTRVLLPRVDDPLSAKERGQFLEALYLTVEEKIYPAFASYRDFLREEVLPAARPDSQPGLAYLPDGRKTYRALIRHHTSLKLSAEEINTIGREEVARIRAEMKLLGQRVLGTSKLSEIQDRLRNDPAMHFNTREEVEAKARSAFQKANAALPAYFRTLPQTECVIVRVPPHEEKDTTIAYYRRPSSDGSRPGRYYINTFAPETRPRYDAEVLAYHEAVPGHHLQLALAQEQEGLPLLRRHEGSTAFVEGWALYTERLCDEMGLYSSDMDRLGLLSFDAWRASRLVVDTGLHAFGWSRAEAIEYMLENTLLAQNNIENEVDRYISWPGQALAYKLGQREILSLRALARRELGPDFSYPNFHDQILRHGSVSLALLRGEIERWLGLVPLSELELREMDLPPMDAELDPRTDAAPSPLQLEAIEAGDNAGALLKPNSTP